ncbi:methyl-accepting chemotaxis protein [Vreelandella aquamarina]
MWRMLLRGYPQRMARSGILVLLVTLTLLSATSHWLAQHTPLPTLGWAFVWVVVVIAVWQLSVNSGALSKDHITFTSDHHKANGGHHVSSLQGLSALNEHDQLTMDRLGETVDFTEDSANSLIEKLININGLAEKLTAYLGEADQQSAKMQRSFEDSSKVIKELAEFIQTLPEHINAQRQDFRLLGERINDLNKRVEVVQEISQRTSLLSLNAAIEAAHAGESGRGFAVVAKEVRELAASSSEAARTITEGIKEVQASVNRYFGHEMENRIQSDISKVKELTTQVQELDEGYQDMRLFYRMLLNAITQHHERLTSEASDALGNIQFQDVTRQITERIQESILNRTEALRTIIQALEAQQLPPWGLIVAISTEYAERDAYHYYHISNTEDQSGNGTGKSRHTSESKIELF